MNRAYALFHVKAVDDERRVITGTATTPEPDRVGDVIEPLGVSFKNPLPLLLYHDSKKPVGQTTFKTPTKDGISFEATIAKIDEPGTLKDRVDEAWHSVRAGLVSGVSIGFRAIEEAFMKDGGIHFLKTEVVELSLVTVPANASATIHSIKQLDLAASGLHTPGVSGTSTVVRLQKAAQAMTIPEQITAFEQKRAASFAAASEIQTKVVSEGRSKDETERETYDGLMAEVKACDKELVDLRDMEKMTITKATPITTTPSAVAASELRGGTATTPIITVKSMQPKGTAFTRMCISMAASKGDSYQAMQRAESYKDMPEVALMTKAAVAAGSTTDATWAGPLAVAQPLVDEFLELLRPRTLLGQIPGLRQVPFNVSVPSQTTGGTYAWVGQNKPKPVTKADYATISVPFAKAAGIIVLTEELVKISSPSAEALVREEMIAGMSQFLDTQFTDPAVTAVANVNPAAITVGASTAAASGVTAAAAKLDLSTSVAVFTAAGIPLAGSVWLMSDSNAWGLSVSLNALGQPLFPGVTPAGGTLFGMPVIVSNNVSTRVVLVHAPSILYADEGGVKIDVSREASIQMDSAPTDTVDATTVYISLWQRNLVGLRAERMITWIRARTSAVRYITAAAYAGT